MNFDFPVSVYNSNLFRIASLLECLRGWRCSISFQEGFWFTFFRFYSWWIVKSPWEISFLFFLHELKLTPSSILFFFLYVCRMASGQEEVLTSQTGRRRGTPRETPTASSLVATMSVEELITATIREVENVVYFTREQFAARLRLPVPSLVKQFLHFTRALPALVHPNAFRILMGCSVLNSLYQLDISLVEICFIYTLKLRIGARLSMSAHSPQLQFVTGLPDSRKTEAKRVVLVKGPWYEISGSPRLPFNLNQSLMFPDLSSFLFLYIFHFPRWWVY